MVKLLIIAIMITLQIGFCTNVFGQQNGYEYMSDQQTNREYVPEIISDMSLFYAPLDGASNLFQKVASFNFMSVRYMPRGYDTNMGVTYLNGISLNSDLSRNIDYPLLTALGRIAVSKNIVWGLSPMDYSVGGLSQTVQLSSRVFDLPAGNIFTVSSSDRRYRLGLRATSSYISVDEGWGYSATASRRWGRDGHIDGVFTDDNVFSISTQYRVKKGHNISLFALAAPMQQGVRSAATRETFVLTGNNLYNPSWGYYDDNVRNARVRESLQPIIIMSYDGPLSKKTTLHGSMSYHFGESSYSGLSWYDAQAPYPDYYRLMPSYFKDQPIEAELRGLWQNNDQNVVQVNWDELVYQNQMNGENPTYILEDKVESRSDYQINVELRTKVNSRLEISYGVRARADRSRNFKRARDLLGGKWFADIDQYLVDDELWGDKLNNNLRNPDRRIHRDDKFGYNYDMRSRSLGIQSLINYRDRRFRLWCGVEGASKNLVRNGHYEKELLPGSSSYGKSKDLINNTYTVKVGGGYSITARQNIDISFMTSNVAPSFENVFVSPDYSNEIIDNVQQVTVNSAELRYGLMLPSVKFSLAAYYTLTENQSQIYHYFDDISTVYSNMTMSDIDKQHYGIEAGAQVEIGSGLTMNLAAALGRYTYNNDPQITITADADSKVVVAGDRTHLKDFRLGSTPQSVCSAELRYSNRGWLATATMSYMADSYVSVSPLRRMARIYELAESPEKFDQFTVQEKLPNAATFNLFLLKSFNIGRTLLYAIISVNNVAGRNNMIYSGYEQMRIAKSGSGVNRTYSPFDTKYTYSYGRTYYCSITYRF